MVSVGIDNSITSASLAKDVCLKRISNNPQLVCTCRIIPASILVEAVKVRVESPCIERNNTCAAQ